jgi:hypothetical protein
MDSARQNLNKTSRASGDSAPSRRDVKRKPDLTIKMGLTAMLWRGSVRRPREIHLLHLTPLPLVQRIGAPVVGEKM